MYTKIQRGKEMSPIRSYHEEWTHRHHNKRTHSGTHLGNK